MTTDSLQTAGDVRIEKVILTTLNGDDIDLTNFMLEITLHESIYAPCMFGSVVLSDAVNLLSKAPIIGRDFITLKIRTPELSDTKRETISRTFTVYAVSDRKLNSDREQFYSIQFMSPEGMIDNIVRLTQKFTGSTDAIAEKIFSEHLASEEVSFTLFDSPHSTNNFEFVANHWSPFKCLNYLAKNSIGKEYKMPNVMFYESNKSFYFTSITSLIQEQLKAKILYDEYSYVTTLDEVTNRKLKKRSGDFTYTSPLLDNTMRTVSKIEYPTHFDQLKNQDSGYYGNTTFAYDFVNKDIYNIEFDYTSRHAVRREQRKNVINQTFSSFKHIADTAPMPEDAISDPLSRIEFRAGASGLFGSNDAFDIEQVTGVCFRNTSLAELEAVKYEITVPGKTDVEVGKLIKFNYPNVSEKTSTPDSDTAFDPLISGIYLITGVRHDITKLGYNMTLEITRDAMGETR